MQKEIWRDIKGYEGKYEVSNLGRVKSLNYARRGKPNVVTPTLGKRGYFYVSLLILGVEKTRSVHQLVAEAFHDHTPCGMRLVVDHINGIKTDNRAVNIRIVTHRENCSLNKGTSKYNGVCWHKRANKWVAQIKISGKRIYLGLFQHEHDAHLAYQNELSKINKTKN